MVFFCIPCLVLILYFLVVGAFVPKYRGFIKEGWTCFMDKIKGRKCSISFDNRMRLAFSMWLAKKGMVRLGRFFNNERNFMIAFTIFGVVFTVVSTYLFVLLVKFLIHSPCTGDVCRVW